MNITYMSVFMRFLTSKSNLAHYKFLVFQTASEMSNKKIIVRYVEFVTSLSTLKGTVDIS